MAIFNSFLYVCQRVICGEVFWSEKNKAVPHNQHPVGHDAAGTAGCSVLVFGPHIPPGPAPSNVQGQTEVP